MNFFEAVSYIQGTFSTGWSHQPVLKVCFGQAKRREAPPPPLVPVGGTNRDQKPRAARAQMFSPTSLAERGVQWFISPTAAPLSSSSPLQAFGPNCHWYARWAYWAFYGPESWPIDGFLVVFTPWRPSRWHIFFYFFPVFLFSFLLYLFCFVSTYNKKLIYFILFCF